MSEAEEEELGEYRSLLELFVRRLKEGKRNISLEHPLVSQTSVYTYCGSIGRSFVLIYFGGFCTCTYHDEKLAYATSVKAGVYYYVFMYVYR